MYNYDAIVQSLTHLCKKIKICVGHLESWFVPNKIEKLPRTFLDSFSIQYLFALFFIINGQPF